MSRRSFTAAVPDQDYWKNQIRCQSACPVHTDARGYVRAIAGGRDDRAAGIARGPNPLATICGRICAARCEAACRRGTIDAPVAVRALKRFALDRGFPASVTPEALASSDGPRDCVGAEEMRQLAAPRSTAPVPGGGGRRVAIVGSGPAGLACAHDLALMGFCPVVFEMESVPAGMMQVGVPEYRLPRAAIGRDVAFIEALGVEIRCGLELGKDLDLEVLLGEFAAVVLAIGAKKSRGLPIPGVEGPGVLGGVEFLRDVSYHRPVELGRRVVVIGGGNVAFDTARTAIRHVSWDVARSAKRHDAGHQVSLVCLESEGEMLADDEEVAEGDREGIRRMNGWGPLRIERDLQGHVTGVTLQRCLRVFDETRRFAPVFDPEQTTTIPCDTVLLSIGQSVDLGFLTGKSAGVDLTDRGLIAADPGSLATSRPGLFVAGDMVRGMGLMVEAVASGKVAARSVRRFLEGDGRELRTSSSHQALPGYAREGGYESVPRAGTSMRPTAERLTDPRIEVDLGLDPESARKEASRCLDCGVNPIFDSDRCILCGGCADVCPESCLKLVRLDQVTGDADLDAQIARWRDRWGGRGGAILKSDDRCIRCAACADRCPVGAITMERFRFEEEYA